MNSLFIFFASVLLCFVVLFFSVIKPPKKKLFTVGLSVPLIFTASFGLSLFFDDMEILFRCDKAIDECECLRSTVIAPELKEDYSFQISDIHHVELKQGLRNVGRYSHRTVYEIVFHFDSEVIKFPYAFCNKERAEEETGTFLRFLKSKQQTYTFHAGHATPSPFRQKMKIGFYISFGLMLIATGYRIFRFMR